MQKLIIQTKARKKGAQKGSSKVNELMDQGKKKKIPDFTPADLGYPVKKGPRPFANHKLSSQHALPQEKRSPSPTLQRNHKEMQLMLKMHPASMSKTSIHNRSKESLIPKTEIQDKVFNLVEQCKVY